MVDGGLEIQQKLINLKQEITRDDLEKMKKTMASYLNEKQTRAFAGALDDLDESKHEEDSINESIKILSLGKKDSDELNNLKNELKLALQAEVQSKKAMDVLALTLIEVSYESNETKAKLRSTETALSFTEEKLREAVEETQRLKQEAEELFVSWNKKEASFISCIKASEKEMREIGKENKRLMESNRASREEISKLRDILKQAVNEAIAVKEELEIARTENRLIKDLVQEKEDAMNGLKQEFESLKVSEAAATDSVKELKALVAATSSMERWRMVEKPVVVRIRRQNSWGEMEGFGRIEGGAGSPLVRTGKEGKAVGFESRRLKMEDGKFIWIKEKKKKQFLRSFSDILRKSCQR